MTAVATAKVIAMTPPPAQRDAALCPWEDARQFEVLRNEFHSSYSPSGPAEMALVERLVMIEWRRKRLVAAEAAVHVAVAFDRAGEDQAKRKTLVRAGVTDFKAREQISVSEILRGTDQDDSEMVAAISEGVADVEASLKLMETGKPYETAVARLDEDMRDWWAGELSEDEPGECRYRKDCESLRRFLVEEALPWRRSWLTINSARPAIRAQAIAESFDPPRIRQLWDMEARLDRQFEKALSMLIRLQEMRPNRPRDESAA